MGIKSKMDDTAKGGLTILGTFYRDSLRAQSPGGHFNFNCTGERGHRIGKLTYPQTKAGTKTDPFSDYLQ